MLTGSFTADLYAKKRNLTRQSAINELSKLKKQRFVTTTGGSKQVRIYTVTTTRQPHPNGFYTIVNKYSPEKLHPQFIHVVHGKYGVEQAIIDGLLLNDVRTNQAIQYLFNHVKDWKLLFALAKKHNIETQVREIYTKARSNIKVRKIPKRYSK